MSAPLKIFIIYAREDESFKISLLKAFKPLHRSGKIEIFHDGLIKPGERWEEAILENLRTAHIILPLVSTDFFDSEFIHKVEFKKAVERYNKGETTIIPIILKHCGWKYDPIIPTLQVLPKDGKPVVAWAFHEEAWEQVLDAVHEVTEQMGKGKEKQSREVEAKAERVFDAINEIEEKVHNENDEIRLKVESSELERLRNWIKSREFFESGEKATDLLKKIKHFSKAIELDPEYIDAYLYRGDSKYLLGHYDEAIKDYDQAIQINPEFADAYYKGGLALIKLDKCGAAVYYFDRFIQTNPKFADAYYNRGLAKICEGCYREAIDDFDRAIQINPEFADARLNRDMAEDFLTSGRL